MRHIRIDRRDPRGPELHPVERADITAARRLAPYERNPVVRAVGTFAKLADQEPLIALTGAVAAWGLLAGNRGLARRGAHLLASVVIASAAKAVVERTVSRTRPSVAFETGVYATGLLGPNAGPWHSFPSGHTAGAVAAARACARGWPAAAPAAYAAAGAVALVQLPRGSHYPSDLAAGALIGLAAEALAARLLPGRPPERA